MKTCNKCNQPKEYTQFPRDKTRKDGYKSICKVCRKSTRNVTQEKEYQNRQDIKTKKISYDKQYNALEEVKSKKSIYSKENYEIRDTKREKRIVEMEGITYKKCITCKKLLELDCFHNNVANQRGMSLQDSCKKCFRDYNNQYYRIKRKREYDKERREIPAIRLANNFSTQMRICLKGNKNGCKWESLVDYTLEDLKQHIESKFEVGMSWDKYGRNGFHIDHIIPLRYKLPSGEYYFNQEELSDPSSDTFKHAWALSNLQPLWEPDNLSKSNTYVG